MKKYLKTEFQIQTTKSIFEKELSKKLHLHKISSPLMVLDGTGINDDLNGIEHPVRFKVKAMNDQMAVVVHSLAKWKKIRLKEYKIPKYEGVITNMNAIRADEDYSQFHSIYVDQWDWEKRIKRKDRSLDVLKNTVYAIFDALKCTEKQLINSKIIQRKLLPKKIHFIQSESLLQMYPQLSPKEREHKIAKKYGAVFIIGIGGVLSDGKSHDGRSSDYDDWSTPTSDGFGLNGDLLVWDPIHEQSLELSSMGIRVDKFSLEKQLKIRKEEYKKGYDYHKKILKDKLPFSVGGGIGQSRLCMFFLQKHHIGEVQVSVWDKDKRDKLQKKGIRLM